MTGEKDRYTTTEKLWKLDDETLTTPKHDEMVLDLLDLEYVKALIPQAFAWYGRDRSFRWYTSHNIVFTEQIQREISAGGEPSEFAINEAAKIYSERNKSVDIAGARRAYDDYLPAFVEGYRWALANRGSCSAAVTITSEVPLTARNGFIIGYADVVVDIFPGGGNHKTFGKSYREVSFEAFTPLAFELHDHTDPKTGRNVQGARLYIEVKPAVRSFGQTLRQLNTYRESIGHGREVPMFLYTSDARFDAAFESQGIKVLHPIPRP